MKPSSECRRQWCGVLGALGCAAAIAGCSAAGAGRSSLPIESSAEHRSRPVDHAAPDAGRARPELSSSPHSIPAAATAATQETVTAGETAALVEAPMLGVARWDGSVEYAVLPSPPALAGLAAAFQDDGDLVEAQPIARSPDSPDFSNPERTGILAVRGGVGFTASPETFLLAGEASYFVMRELGIGPLVQLGFTDDRLIFAPTLNLRGVFDISEPALAQLKPFVAGGLGFAYLYKDGRNGDNDDLGFLFNLGGGFDFYVTNQVSVGTSMLFNIIPDKTLGDHFFFSWQVLTVGFGF